jgi:CRISPR-associated protein Cas1
LEGTASRQYFKILAHCLPHNYQFKGRSGKGATDRFNAVLNYLYGMLYGQVELALIQAGIDPHIGVLHVDQYNRPTMVYDFIEPYRIWAEQVAVRLLMGQKLEQRHFVPNGKALWLAGDGKKYVIDGFVRFIEEKEYHQGKQYVRERWLNWQAQQFAQHILNS